MQIGPYKLDTPLILAPMAGVTDRPFRQLCLRMGAGMAVSDTPYRHVVQNEVKPFAGLLLGLFFMSVGMGVNLPAMAAIWPAVSRDEVDALAGAGQTLRQASGRRAWTRTALGGAAPEALTLAARGYSVRLQWLARGDFDGDGWEDWLLRWQARAEGGSWRAVRCVLLTRKMPAGAFTVGP